MRLFWKHRHPCYFDYSQVMENFIRDLGILAAHIREHGHLVDSARIASQIEVAIAKLKHTHDFEGAEPPDRNEPDWKQELTQAWAEQYKKEEDAAWNDAWDYIKEHGRGWWD